jgi:hypothetical protein
VAPLQHSALRLPQQDLERCNLFDCTIDGVAAWIANLPLGSPSRAGVLLRTAISEVNRVPLAPDLRFDLLEALREPARSAIKALEKTCLNQPIVLEEDAQIQADIITDLFALLAAGYALVAVSTIRGDETNEELNPARLAGEALHRSMVATGHRIRFAYLLYQPIELNTWATLHQLYALAERQQLARLPVDDPLREIRSTITHEYTPPLLLACSKPNQLRQHDIKGAYRAYQEWCEYVELQDPEFGEGLFAVDLQADQAPLFAELLVRRGNAQFRFINTKRLVRHLEELRQMRSAQGVRVIEFDRETRMDTNLLEHLIKSLSEISQRNFARQPSRATLHIAAGLSDVHYFVAGERSLHEVFYGVGHEESASERADANPFLAREHRGDQWQEANPEEDVDESLPHDESALPVDIDKITRAALEQDASSDRPARYVVHSVKTMNTSAGGYCVEWDDPPQSARIGDVVCVRETDNEQGEWTIAVIRWISQIKHAPTLLGLELISPRATAYAARIKMPSGEYTRPIRVLLLPEIPLVGQAHTLIVPRLVFKESQRITVSRNEDGFLVKLKNQVSSTGYFSQMDFDYIRQLDDDIAASSSEPHPEEKFDSFWSEL